MERSYHFTERVRHVLALAREEAARLGHEYVGTEHVLLGLIKEGNNVAISVLANLGIDPEALRRKVDETVKRGTVTAEGDRPYTSRAKRVLELAMNEVRELGHNYVGTEHLLLGLLVEEKGIAAQVLTWSGVTTANARAETVRLVGVEGNEADARARGSAGASATLASTPRSPAYQKAFVAMWWTLGIVALIESIRLFIRGTGMSGGTSVGLVSVGLLEAAGALLFLAPRTLKFGALILLGVFAAGFIGHLVRGQFLTQFLVYAAATHFVLVSRITRRPSSMI